MARVSWFPAPPRPQGSSGGVIRAHQRQGVKNGLVAQ